MNLHVSCAFKLFIDHIVHAGSGFNKCGCNNRETSAVFNVACSTEETLGFMQRTGIHSAGQGFAGGIDGQVIGTGKPCDGVHKNDNVLAHFNKTHGTFHNHFGNAGVMLGKFVKS